MEEVQQVAAQPKKFLKSLTMFEIALIVLACGYIIYLNQQTSRIPNLNNGNSTIVVNTIPIKPGELLYGPNDLVPKTNVSNTQTFFGILIILLLVYTLLLKVTNVNSRASIHEAVEDITKQIIQVRQLKDARIAVIKNGKKITSDLEDIEITYNFLTRYRIINNLRQAFNYTIHINILDKSTGLEDYYKAYYHPWDRFWDGLVKSSKQLSDVDQCPNCGKEFDVKIITSDDLSRARAARRGIGDNVR